MRIVHFTTVHPRTDTRIRVKEVTSLARALDADVQLFVQDGLGDETDVGSKVRIHDTGSRPRGRFARMTFGAWRMYRAVRRAAPTIAHFHDPELIPVGLLLKFLGCIVIYDVHEDLSRQVLAKRYIPGTLRLTVSRLASAAEWVASKAMDQIILAGASLSDRFPPEKSVVIYNYPVLTEFEALTIPQDRRDSKQFIYVGGLSRSRGLFEMVRSIALLEDTSTGLTLGGRFESETLHSEVESETGWAQTSYLKILARQDVWHQLHNSVAGLVILHPTESYQRSYPTKLFEYMMAGLPVIASDFEFWRDILKGIDCALFVDPLDPRAIADAMQWVLDHPEEAAAMGRRGQNAVRERFNWDAEGAKLISLYRRLLGVDKSVQELGPSQ
jgi:glycosyltransferase involved in cell wall biosynthesis